MRLPSPATAETGISACLPLLWIFFVSWLLRFVCLIEVHGGRHSETRAMTLDNSKHTTESSLEQLFPPLPLTRLLLLLYLPCSNRLISI